MRTQRGGPAKRPQGGPPKRPQGGPAKLPQTYQTTTGRTTPRTRALQKTRQTQTSLTKPDSSKWTGLRFRRRAVATVADETCGFVAVLLAWKDHVFNLIQASLLEPRTAVFGLALEPKWQECVVAHVSKGRRPDK